jgi:hypothetical protein
LIDYEPDHNNLLFLQGFFPKPQDPAEDKAKNDLGSHSAFSSMFFPREMMDFFTEYWEKWLL